MSEPVSPDAWVAFQPTFQVRQFGISEPNLAKFSAASSLTPSAILTKMQAGQAVLNVTTTGTTTTAIPISGFADAGV